MSTILITHRRIRNGAGGGGRRKLWLKRIRHEDKGGMGLQRLPWTCDVKSSRLARGVILYGTIVAAPRQAVKFLDSYMDTPSVDFCGLYGRCHTRIERTNMVGLAVVRTSARPTMG